ncbi:acetyltransferase [Solemya velesiana gill symbiont]|uniref:Acetyltransferase n=1 Tax=Solemya velesiana gill symbiont TaxID=1918948 RepID=A0A1T2KNE0_9GAMM|nr:acetyltransferase [Solemya velesiana gill symbiont]OOZ34230.1 acetyltransferase [Solemya velesiana gill symbiont]
MTTIDVFNGDADGICALVQLRLNEPKEAQLVTGIKRDIKLLERVDVAPEDEVTVLDISMAKNSDEMNRVLEQGASVFYVDHHMPGEIPRHPRLTAIIDTDPNTCTSLLVDNHLQGRYRAWAVTAAFGDNMTASAEEGAKVLNITADELEQLKLLGICINYNGYGSCIEDLHFAPDELYRELVRYTSPFDFIGDSQSVFEKLRDGYLGDMASAQEIEAEHINDSIAVVILPDEAWSRRISGVYGNQLANEHPDRAHAILSYNRHGGYLVSVRAPLNNKTGADELCSSFASGGGRKGAAGINHLPMEELHTFIERFSTRYSN